MNERLPAPHRTVAWLAATGHYLWGGWGAVTSLFLLLAAWDFAAQGLGPLILPTPLDTLQTLHRLLAAGPAWGEIAITARRALTGFLLSAAAGSILGLAAGLSATASLMSRPIVTVLVGTPPIAWLVLALLWFGVGDGTPVFTVFIACFPVVFVGAMLGARTLDGRLREMARAFRLPAPMMLADIYLPHVVSYLFPAWISALGMSWKVVVMAELLATPDGIGAALAVARSHLDMAASMAWISALVGVLLAIEYLLLEPLKRRVESWREDASSST